MTQYFYAYHGPQNSKGFDPSGGYGVSQKHKHTQVNEGDLVYIIQKIGKSPYELCGLFEITEKYEASKEEISKRNLKKPYRFRMKESPLSSGLVIIDEDDGNTLPPIKGNETWSNFQRYFCRQGSSFQSPLDENVISFLRNISQQDISKYEAKFRKSIQESLLSSPGERAERLRSASKIPPRIRTSVEIFVRNPDVVAEALHRANGICGDCKQKAPFIRRSNNQPYLEVHHIKRLADGGEDTIENAIALCPNCHRKNHFGL